MRPDTVSTDRLVHCPCCADPMRLVPAGPYDDPPKMQTFECERCGAAVMAESALDTMEVG